MSRIPLAVGSALMLLAPALTWAAGPDVHKPSFPVEADAEAFVGKYRREELARDEVFVAALQKLAGSGLSARSRADAFALMQERIGWLFTGAARLFPGCGYAQTQAMILSTYIEYQQRMPEGLDVRPLLELAEGTRGDHPFRPSNALLLAIILNRSATKESVAKALDAKTIASSKVPAIELHNLSLAAALTGDAKVVARAVALLPVTDSEESREDLIAATAIYREDDLRGAIENFVRGRFPASFDNSVQTALMVLAHAGPSGHFRGFYKSLGDLTKDEKDIDLLRKFWDSGFRDRLQSDDPARQPLKIWDGFTFRMENEGGWISYGDSYRYWISFK